MRHVLTHDIGVYKLTQDQVIGATCAIQEVVASEDHSSTYIGLST